MHRNIDQSKMACAQTPVGIPRTGEIWVQTERLQRALAETQAELERHREFIRAVRAENPTIVTNAPKDPTTYPPTQTELGGELYRLSEIAEYTCRLANELNEGIQV